LTSLSPQNIAGYVVRKLKTHLGMLLSPKLCNQQQQTRPGLRHETGCMDALPYNIGKGNRASALVTSDP